MKWNCEARKIFVPFVSLFSPIWLRIWVLNPFSNLIGSLPFHFLCKLTQAVLLRLLMLLMPTWRCVNSENTVFWRFSFSSYSNYHHFIVFHCVARVFNSFIRALKRCVVLGLLRAHVPAIWVSENPNYFFPTFHAMTWNFAIINTGLHVQSVLSISSQVLVFLDALSAFYWSLKCCILVVFYFLSYHGMSSLFCEWFVLVILHRLACAFLCMYPPPTPWRCGWVRVLQQ